MEGGKETKLKQCYIVGIQSTCNKQEHWAFLLVTKFCLSSTHFFLWHLLHISIVCARKVPTTIWSPPYGTYKIRSDVA